jgi:hypothetical protein
MRLFSQDPKTPDCDPISHVSCVREIRYKSCNEGNVFNLVEEQVDCLLQPAHKGDEVTIRGKRPLPFVLLFTGIALLTYGYASLQLERQIAPLRERCQHLEQKLDTTRQQRIELEEMVASLSDPAAVEHALIAELGRVPEGKRKIAFGSP